MRRVFKRIAAFFASIAARISKGLHWLTFHVSRITTGALAIGGALCGINTVGGELQTGRLAIAGFAFIIGLPLGLMLLGPAFSTVVWMGIVTGILFLMNLHCAWEVLLSLKYGGLDFIMAQQSAASIENITPSEQDWKALETQVKRVRARVKANALNYVPFEGRLLKESP